MASQFSTFGVNTDYKINIPGLEVPQLIISEVRPDNERTAYVELTNMGTETLDLSNFDLHSVFWNSRLLSINDSAMSFNRANAAVDNTIGKVNLSGMLAPGESYVISSVWESDNANGTGIPNMNTAVAELSDKVVNKNENADLNTYGWIDAPQWKCWGKDSISMYSLNPAREERLYGDLSAGYILHWHFEVEAGVWDSTYIDQFNTYLIDGMSYTDRQGFMLPIAGVPDAMATSIMIRKPGITKGNMNWTNSRGGDAITSEWLVLPKNTARDKAFTTVGKHGTSTLDYSVKDASVIVLDKAAKTMSIPWEIVRGDSLINYFNIGDNMTWSYTRNESFEDSASYIARTGDKFAFYAVGSEVAMEEYTLNVRDSEEDLAVVFPVRRVNNIETINYDENGVVIDTTFTQEWPVGFVYGVTDTYDQDSIINVGFGARTDTLLKYLESPAGSQLDFIFVDGKERVDLMFGDKLKVTSKDGNASKEYVISVKDYVRNSNALLSTVTWPDVDLSVYYKWTTGDTLPDFVSTKANYVVELSRNQKTIPAFQFKTENLRSHIQVTNATDIDGTEAQRTTSVDVIAEDDTTIQTYKFVFVRQGAKVQPNVAEPFISEMIWNVATQGCAVEIFNPGTEEIDLSQYMYVAGKTSDTWQMAVERVVADAGYTSGDGLKIYQTHYCPSKRWSADGTAALWAQTGTPENEFVGKGFLKDDGVTDSWVEGGDVWVMGVGTSGSNKWQKKIRAESDFIFRGTGETLFAWDSTKILHRETPIWNDPRHNMWLLKILNDSIIDGTMDVRDASQYELIDRFEVIGDTIAGRLCKGKNWQMRRKPSVRKGTMERTGGGLSTAESSEWILEKTTDVGADITGYIGVHTMDPWTNFKSTVTSVKFDVTTGYEGDALTITGDVSANTPATIATMLDKADDSQTFAFTRAGAPVTGNLADGDILAVTSGDQKSTTNYKLVDQPLGTSTALSAKSGSSLAVAGTKVTGVVVGTTIAALLEDLEVEASSSMNVLDATSGALQPLMMHDRDTNVYEVLVSTAVSIQVVAENGASAVYTLDFGMASTDAVLFSSLMTVNQETKVIFGKPEGSTAEMLMRVVSANEGASIMIKDKAGFERAVGFVYEDDVIEVTAADGTTKVLYTFADETSGIKNVRAKNSIDVELYPNPASDVLFIGGMDAVSVKVYSLAGSLMIDQAVYGTSVDVSSLQSGVYMVKLMNAEGKIALSKFLKK